MARTGKPQRTTGRTPRGGLLAEKGIATLTFAPPKGQHEKISLPVGADGFTVKMTQQVLRLLPEAVARSERPSPGLAQAEQVLLDQGGLHDRPSEAAQNVAQTVTEYARLRAESLSVAETARLLGVDPSRIRQRLVSRPPTLYGIRDGHAWLLPRFQFADGGGEVPGIGVVVARLDPELHPLEVLRWFLTPNPDLVIGESEEAVSPRDSLRSGHPPEVVAVLAGEL